MVRLGFNFPTNVWGVKLEAFFGSFTFGRFQMAKHNFLMGVGSTSIALKKSLKIRAQVVPSDGHHHGFVKIAHHEYE